MSNDTLVAPDGFTTLELHPKLLQALGELGYEEPTPIQREAIPPLLEGRDLLGQAATGTGKTAAFALPMLHRLATGDSASDEQGVAVQGLVLVPTRELAIQVAEAMHRYGRGLGVRVLPVYGGQSIQQQLRALRRGIHVVVATPGRALDHIRRGSLRLDQVRSVVLDEADEMLDMGFADDLEAILDELAEERQMALLSATMPPRITAIARRHLRNPVNVRIAREVDAVGDLPRVRQVGYVVQRQHKVAALGRVLDMEQPTSALVFCRTRTEVDELTEKLGARGYRAEALHGGFSQEQRDRVMKRFRSGAAELLIATDVAARGLDIEQLSHVINFDVPSAPDAYVHRIGRTGRAGREGVAITLAEPRESRLIRNIEQLTGQRIHLEAVPTLLDLQARRVEMVRASLREVMLTGELDQFRGVVETLADEFDITDVAAAAVKLAHEAMLGDGEEDDVEIPVAPARREREGRAGGRTERGDGRAARDRQRTKAGRESRRAGRDDTDVTRLYIGVGRRAGVRPADLVGAIANEAQIDSRSIGAIEIADGFSLVEVPESEAGEIISALRSATIRGRRVVVRVDRDAR